ncbi:MAG: AAA family ATPase [Solirubrobacteraceae bacterium]|nr:AAA family ATPase [Solirubrobacteraceae bacterium]
MAVAELMGRTTELAAVHARLEAAGAGESAAVVLVGEAGMGKSTMLRAVTEAATERGLTVLRARAVEAEQGLPFAGLHELLLPVIDATGQVAPHHARALHIALGLEPGEPQPPFALAVALLALLGAIADDAPEGLLLAVDDAQWLDDDSLDALRFVGRRLGAEGIVLLLAARPEPDRGLRDQGFDVVTIAPLEDEAATAVLHAAAPAELAAGVAAQLLAASGGSPLALVELASHLTADQATGAAALADPPLPTGAIEGSFRADLDGLPASVAAALLVAAADERASRAELASAILRLGGDPAALTQAEAAGLVIADGARLLFRHPLLRAVAYHRATGAEQRAAHQALAAVVDGEARQTAHLAAATDHPDEAVAERVATQAAAAVARGALDAGSRGYERAAELSPDPTNRARRTARAATLYATLGQPDRALRLVESVRADDLTDPAVRVTLDRIRGETTMRSGRLDEGYGLLLALAEQMSSADPAQAAEVLVMAGLRDRIVGDYPSMAALTARAAELAGDGLPIHAAFAGVLQAIVLVNTGDTPGADAAIERSFATFDADGFGAFSDELRASASHCLIWLGHLDRAAAHLQRQISEARARDALTALICPLTVQAQLDLRRGRLSAAFSAANEALTMAVETRQLGFFAFAAGFLAETEAALGREPECREHAGAAIAIADAVGGAALSLWSRSALGMLELGLGRYDEAIAALEECRAISERIGLVEPSVVQWRGNHVEALFRAGRHEEARASLAAFERGVPSTGWSWATAARLRGLLDEEDGVEELMASVAAFDAAGTTFEAARSRLALGERLRRLRRRRESREPLRMAINTFEQAGATPWATRAREELRATGESIVAGGAIATDDLTPNELRVALLVADGRTNPEVAAELYMARKTVEHHLSQIYRKLGLRGRTELARALAAS